MMSRLCLENDLWQEELVKKLDLKNVFVDKYVFKSMCWIDLMPTVDVNLTSTIDVKFLTYG